MRTTQSEYERLDQDVQDFRALFARNHHGNWVCPDYDDTRITVFKRGRWWNYVVSREGERGNVGPGFFPNSAAAVDAPVKLYSIGETSDA